MTDISLELVRSLKRIAKLEGDLRVALAQLDASEQEKQRQYDQAVEATGRALRAEAVMRLVPWDHNGECLYCDEQHGHDPDCAWLAAYRELVAQMNAQAVSVFNR